MQCEWCNGEFEARANQQRFCTRKCRMAARHVREAESQPLAICKRCGVVFRPKKSDRRQYCSYECALHRTGALAPGYKDGKATRKNSFIARLVRILARIKECRVCGKRTLTSECSAECREEHSRRASREFSQQRKEETCGVRRCYQCGNEFIPEYGNKHRRFCSRRCLGTFVGRQNKRRRRIRKWQASYLYEHFADWEIFERDGWRCMICMLPIRREVDRLHLQAATIDHIVPLSRGGSHTRDNVQCAHRICNSLKNEMLPSQSKYRVLLQMIRGNGGSI